MLCCFKLRQESGFMVRFNEGSEQNNEAYVGNFNAQYTYIRMPLLIGYQITMNKLNLAKSTIYHI